MPPQKPGPRSDLQSFAEAISSASDPELAAWQERGLTPPATGGSLLVWAILVVSGTVGVVLGSAAWMVAWHALGGMSRSPSIASSKLQDPALILILAGLVVLLIAGATSFALFQLLSRFVYRIQRPRRL